MTWALLAGASASFCLTWLLRRYALTRTSLIDVPNERSSHRDPTPRGGGLAIAIAFLGLLPALWVLGVMPFHAFVALVGGGALTALVGFWDDHRPIPAAWRLVAHFAAAAWVVGWFGGIPSETFANLLPAWLTDVLVVMYVVWLLNLYNFMDGIDGIASVEAVTVSLGGVLLYLIVAPGDPSWAAPALLSVAVAGFGFWNWPPARIFMGDAGSGFIGLTLAGLAIQASWDASRLFWAWTILLGVFIVDASVTLARRVWSGHRYDEAHRSHAYQHAARRFHSHKLVTLAVGVINAIWLLPLALLVAVDYLAPALGLFIAYSPLLLLALALGAGKHGARAEPRGAQ